MTKPILTSEHLKERLLYDSETGNFIWKTRMKGSNRKIGSVAGSIHKHGYRVINILKYTFPCHQLAWLYVYGYLPKEHIDHINGIRSDNRIENLRAAGRIINAQNQRGPSKNNKTGFLGVCFVAKRKKFAATIRANGKCKTIGYFDSASDAHQAYLMEKRKYHLGCTI